MPHHVIQRGNNRQADLRGPRRPRDAARAAGRKRPRFGVALHAYVLMDNHFHLLATPDTPRPACRSSCSRWGAAMCATSMTAMAAAAPVGRALPVHADPDRPLPADLHGLHRPQPRAGGLVADARDFPWSSHGHYAGLRHDKLLTPHPLYWALGNTPFAREAAYAELVRAGVRAADQTALTEATLRGWAAGRWRFSRTASEIAPSAAWSRPRPAGRRRTPIWLPMQSGSAVALLGLLLLFNMSLI
jgi:putative transposase